MTIAILLAVLAMLLVLGFTAPVALGVVALLYYGVLGPISNPDLFLEFLSKIATDPIFEYTLGAIVLFIFYGRLCAAMDIRARLATCLTRMFGSARISASAGEILTSLAMPDTAGDALLQRNDDAATTVNRLRLAGTAGWSAIGQAAALASLRTLMPPGVAIIIVAYIFEQSVYELFRLMIGPVLVIALLIFLLALFGGRDKEAMRGDLDEAEWRSVVWLVVTPLILAVILGGVMTPAEAGAFAVALAILLGLVLRQLSLRLFFRATLDALYDTGAIFLVVVFARGLSFALAYENAPAALSSWTYGFDWELILVGMILLVIVTGALTGLLITLFGLAPLIFPLGAAGFEIEVTGLAILLAATIGLNVPPVGAIFATLAAGTTEPVHRIVRGVAVFTIPFLVALAVMTLLEGSS